MRIETIEELMGRQYPEQVWAVEGLFPSAATSILSGPPANFKTWVLLSLAKEVAQGGKLFDYFQASKTNVLLIDQESGPRLLQQRLNKMNAGDVSGIFFYHHGDFVLTAESAETLIETCEHHSIGLVIIDSLVRIHHGDENKSGDMARVFEHIKTLNTAGLTVILTHHNRKPGANAFTSASEMRGSSDILASIDAHLSLTRKSDTLTFHQTKQRYAEELKPFKVYIVEDESLALQYGGSAKNEDEYKLRETILERLASHAGVNQLQLSQILDSENAHVNEHKLRKTLKELVSQNLIVEERGVGKTLHYSLIKQEETA